MHRTLQVCMVPLTVVPLYSGQVLLVSMRIASFLTYIVRTCRGGFCL